jgi:hypothetical protein
VWFQSSLVLREASALDNEQTRMLLMTTKKPIFEKAGCRQCVQLV